MGWWSVSGWGVRKRSLAPPPTMSLDFYLLASKPAPKGGNTLIRKWLPRRPCSRSPSLLLAHLVEEHQSAVKGSRQGVTVRYWEGVAEFLLG